MIFCETKGVVLVAIAPDQCGTVFQPRVTLSVSRKAALPALGAPYAARNSSRCYPTQGKPTARVLFPNIPTKPQIYSYQGGYLKNRPEFQPFFSSPETGAECRNTIKYIF
jgi:hypothetical protein